jgi:hypothetical protein
MRRHLAVALSAVAIAGAVPACSRARCCAPRAALPAVASGGAAPTAGTTARFATVSVRVVQAPRETIADAFGPGLADGKFHARVPSLDEAARIRRRLERDPRARILSAPSITIYEGKDARLTIANEISYVSSFDVESQGDAFLADPVVSVVAEGFEANVTVDRADVGPKYLATVKLDCRHIDRPIPEERIAVAVGTTPLRVQRPVVSAQGIETRVPLADGGSVLLASMDAAIGELPGPILVWVTVEEARDVSAVDPGVVPPASTLPPSPAPSRASPAR